VSVFDSQIPVVFQTAEMHAEETEELDGWGMVVAFGDESMGKLQGICKVR
jgi:hypothetical protein